MNKEFQVHKLNATGFVKAHAIASAFDDLLEKLSSALGQKTSREFSICRTKLEEAAFFAKKAMASDETNTDGAT